MLHKMILCFFMKNDIFSALIVQYYCRHGLLCFERVTSYVKIGRRSRDILRHKNSFKGEKTQSTGHLSTANNGQGNQDNS